MTNRRVLSGSRANRDRRDVAFCRAVITIAEQRRRDDEAAAREAVEEAECDWCGKTTCGGDCPQYYEAMQDQMEEGYEDD